MRLYKEAIELGKQVLKTDEKPDGNFLYERYEILIGAMKTYSFRTTPAK